MWICRYFGWNGDSNDTKIGDKGEPEGTYWVVWVKIEKKVYENLRHLCVLSETNVLIDTFTDLLFFWKSSIIFY